MTARRRRDELQKPRLLAPSVCTAPGERHAAPRRMRCMPPDHTCGDTFVQLVSSVIRPCVHCTQCLDRQHGLHEMH